jgi:hypothetical protein
LNNLMNLSGRYLGTPKRSLARRRWLRRALNSQDEGFRLFEPCQLTACRIFQQQLDPPELLAKKAVVLRKHRPRQRNRATIPAELLGPRQNHPAIGRKLARGSSRGGTKSDGEQLQWRSSNRRNDPSCSSKMPFTRKYVRFSVGFSRISDLENLAGCHLKILRTGIVEPEQEAAHPLSNLPNVAITRSTMVAAPGLRPPRC